MPRSTPWLLASFTVFLLSLTTAQAQAPNLPVRAVVSYANLLTPVLAGELAQTSEGDDTGLAKAIVNRHAQDGTISREVAVSIHNAIIAGVLPHETFMIYLADVVNGLAPAPTSLAAALAYLESRNVSYPPVDASGNVTETSLNAGLAPDVEPVVGGGDDDTNEAISPTTDL